MGSYIIHLDNITSFILILYKTIKMLNMKTFIKGLGAIVYSFIQAWIINLMIIAMVCLILKIFSLSWFWIIIIFFFVWGIIECFRDSILGLMAMPYIWLAKKPAAIVVPIIYLVINAIWLLFKICTDEAYPSGTKAVLFLLLVIYECLMMAWKSIAAMISVIAQSDE